MEYENFFAICKVIQYAFHISEIMFLFLEVAKSFFLGGGGCPLIIMLIKSKICNLTKISFPFQVNRTMTHPMSDFTNAVIYAFSYFFEITLKFSLYISGLESIRQLDMEQCIYL